MKRLSALLMSLWLGAQIGFGYIVAPIVFGFDGMDKAVAGSIAGSLFHASNWLGLLAWGVVFVACGQQSPWSQNSQKSVRKWIVALLILLIVNEFGIAPLIAALKSGETHWLSVLYHGADAFKVWHGVSSIIHVMQTVLGLGLAVKLLRLDTPH